MTKTEMVWDLSQLVDRTDPQSIEKELKIMMTEAENLRERYHHKIETLNAKGLIDLLEAKDAYGLKFEGVTMYCRLMYSADSTRDVAKQLHDAARRALMRVAQTLAFINIELGNLLVRTPSLVTNPLLAEYRHYLERILRSAPHMLSETAERLIILKDKNGVHAWQTLQADWLSTRTFEIEVEGEIKTLPYGKIIGFYQSPDRDLRKRAYQTVYTDLGKDEIIWASALRAVCEDHLHMSEIRKYPMPMSQSLLANDVDQQTIDSLMNTIDRNVTLYQRYLEVKAKVMNLKRLANYDILAPLSSVSDREYTWRKTRTMMIKAYNKFDAESGEWVKEMFEKRHIDGEIRNGKRSGAFCSPWLAGKSAYILQSFNGKIRDVYTQTHELGHAIHAYLGSRAQKPSNYRVGSCVAETGSIFGELILTEHLLSEAKTREEKQTILATILDEFGMAAFQVSARVFFEQSLYDAIEHGKFLDGETISRLWVMARNKIYGDSVDWLRIMKWEWTMKAHYYMANYRFYNYPYVFAQLFVFALYKLYKEQGARFVPRLKELLAAGSSKAPIELALEVGFDIRKTSFWEKGIKQAEAFIDILEATLSE